MMRKLSLILPVLLLVALSGVGPAHAQCSTGAANDGVHASIRSFGRLGEDPFDVWIGESFLLDCAAQILTLEIDMILPGYPNGEHLAIEEGDTLRCTIFDQDHQRIMVDQVVIPTAETPQTILFDFSDHEFRLAAGTLYFLVNTPQDRWGYIYLGTDYPDGAAQLAYDGTNWYEQSLDTSFNLTWDPESGFVASEETSWDALKAYYR